MSPEATTVVPVKPQELLGMCISPRAVGMITGSESARMRFLTEEFAPALGMFDLAELQEFGAGVISGLATTKQGWSDEKRRAILGILPLVLEAQTPKEEAIQPENWVDFFVATRKKLYPDKSQTKTTTMDRLSEAGIVITSYINQHQGAKAAEQMLTGLCIFWSFMEVRYTDDPIEKTNIQHHIKALRELFSTLKVDPKTVAKGVKKLKAPEIHRFETQKLTLYPDGTTDQSDNMRFTDYELRILFVLQTANASLTKKEFYHKVTGKDNFDSLGNQEKAVFTRLIKALNSKLLYLFGSEKVSVYYIPQNSTYKLRNLEVSFLAKEDVEDTLVLTPDGFVGEPDSWK